MTRPTKTAAALLAPVAVAALGFYALTGRPADPPEDATLHTVACTGPVAVARAVSNRPEDVPGRDGGRTGVCVGVWVPDDAEEDPEAHLPAEIKCNPDTIRPASEITRAECDWTGCRTNPCTLPPTCCGWGDTALAGVVQRRPRGRDWTEPRCGVQSLPGEVRCVRGECVTLPRHAAGAWREALPSGHECSPGDDDGGR